MASLSQDAAYVCCHNFRPGTGVGSAGLLLPLEFHSRIGMAVPPACRGGQYCADGCDGVRSYTIRSSYTYHINCDNGLVNLHFVCNPGQEEH